MKTKTIDVKVKLVYEGIVRVQKVKNRKQAQDKVDRHFGALLGDLHGYDGSIEDWDFYPHPVKKIIK